MNPKNPFPYSFSNKRYHTWDYHLKERFGGKVFKVSLDGGFSCPNIDGTKGKGGCTYCAYSFKRQSAEDLLTQFRQGVEALHRKWPDAQQYIPYFQANTNTYAPVSELREKYEAVLGEPGVVGLSIATRADALPDEVLSYLEELSRRTYPHRRAGASKRSRRYGEAYQPGPRLCDLFGGGTEALGKGNSHLCSHYQRPAWRDAGDDGGNSEAPFPASASLHQDSSAPRDKGNQAGGGIFAGRI